MGYPAVKAMGAGSDLPRSGLGAFAPLGTAKLAGGSERRISAFAKTAPSAQLCIS